MLIDLLSNTGYIIVNKEKNKKYLYIKIERIINIAMKGTKVPVKLFERQLIGNNWLPVLSFYFSAHSYDFVFY